mmetsp:Transcript_73437/g.215376  ORF Transcript_73437/g.215376 Transcript_73437/m.215376 type:complete len:300 (+) Transcript_73437:685-1584(+)
MVALHHALLVVPLDRRVRQVHKLVVDGVGIRGVRHRGEAGKPILVDEGLQGVEGCDCHIRAHVPLVVAKEERVADVLLDDRQLPVVHGPHVVDHLNPAAAAAACRLHDPEVGDLLRLAGGRHHRGLLVLLGPLLALEVPVLLGHLREALDEEAVLLRQHKGPRADVEVLGVLPGALGVPVDEPLQAVLSRQVLVLWEVVDLLPATQARVVQLWLAPGPAEVPAVGQAQPVRKLLPAILLMEDARHDVVDLRAALDHLVVLQAAHVPGSLGHRSWDRFRRGVRHLVDDTLEEDAVEASTP